MKKLFLTFLLLSSLSMLAQDSLATKISLKGKIYNLSGNGNVIINEGGLTGAQMVDSLDNEIGNSDWQLSGGAYPSTANQIYLSEHSSKIIIHDSLFKENYEARELVLTVNDSTEFGDGVTSVNYNKWIYIRGLGVDSLYLRPIDNDSILPAGSNNKIANGQGLVFPNNETIAARKRDANNWDFQSIDGVLHIEQNYLYTIADAINPNQENSTTEGIIGQSTPGSYSYVPNSVVVQNGNHSIRVDREVASGYPVLYNQTTNIKSGDEIRVTFYVFRPDDGSGSNVQIKLDDDGEWVTQQVQNVGFAGYGVWTPVDLTGVAAKDNPRIEIGHTAQNDNAYYYYDNINLEKLN